MSAAATRYSGSFATGTYSTILPRVRYWAIWNEPNLRKYLSPQVVGQKAVAPATYRALLNAGANAVHGVAASNVVIGGETSPFGAPPSQRARPLKFMEQVLCVSDKPDKRVNGAWTYKYKSACKTKVKFDIWSQHPYTEGGPTVKANTHGDLPLGNMNDMRDVLNTAVRANHVVAPHGVRLWITEFSWDSKPPDPGGVPTALEARWVSQTLYQLWKTGVSMLTWFIVRDQPYPDSFYQSGLYTYSPGNSDDPTLDRPKPALTAFRFPFVAVPVSKAAATIWGRTPDSSSDRVQIQRKSGGQWKLVKTLQANGAGIFQARINPAGSTVFRARLSNGKDTSIPFSLIEPKKQWTGCAFGFGCHVNSK